jgi:hypothetical protein
MGGGRIDGGMLRAGLEPQRLALESVERRTSDVLWLRYRVEERTT